MKKDYRVVIVLEWEVKGSDYELLRYKSGHQVSDSINLLISMLIRYPEISSICCKPDTKEIKFTFLLDDNENNINEFSKLINKCLDTLFYLKKGEVINPFNIKYNTCGKLTVLEIYRKLDNLTSQELNLIISLTQEYFKGSLVVEVEELAKEDQLFQEDLIGAMLDNLGQELTTQKFFAFREEGRVMVFNK